MSQESKALAEKAQKLSGKQVGDLLMNNMLVIIMIVAAIAIAIYRPAFVSASSIINIISLTAAYLPAALGIAGCIVLTGTDLSAGRAVGLTACVSASLLQTVTASNKMWPGIGTLPIPVVIIIAMGIGALVGAFNGFFVGKFKLHPFIVTLGTQLILYTLLLLYVQQGNNGGGTIGSLDESYTNFVRAPLFSIPAGNGGSIPIPRYVLYSILLAVIIGLSGTRPPSVRTCSLWAPTKRPPGFPASTCWSPPLWSSPWPAPCTAGLASLRAPAWPPTTPIPV